jgi:hypothetical protein
MLLFSVYSQSTKELLAFWTARAHNRPNDQQTTANEVKLQRYTTTYGHTDQQLEQQHRHISSAQVYKYNSWAAAATQPIGQQQYNSSMCIRKAVTA